MTLPGSRPWLLSLGLHLLVGAGLLLVLAGQVQPAPPPVRVHWLSRGSALPAAGTPRAAAAWTPAVPARPPAADPGVPSWREAVPAAGTVPGGALVPVTLEELLPGGTATPVPAEGTPAPADSGWSSPGGEGYQPPPLPPPGLAPPQGARWSLVITVPGGGGPAVSVEGLDSGHPDLDSWLESYLRTVSFPAGLDGKEHQLRWTLELHSGRPR